MTTLGALLAAAGIDAPIPADASGITVSTVELDSRKCMAGSVFVCMDGTTTSGTAFVDDAISRGAVCVVAATPVPNAPVVVTVEPDTMRGALAALSGAVVGWPADALTLAGVTGTNGKTTVTWLVRGILSEIGYTAATIGTLTGERTTPAAPDMQRELRTIADAAAASQRPGAAAIEVSSHALDQGRVDGIRFDVAVFTNLSHEHLDYHGSMASYFEAKAALFESSRAAAAVVCVDDEWGRALCERRGVPTVQVDSSDADLLDADLGSTRFRWQGVDVTTPLTGLVNVTNAMLALAAVEVLGVDVHEAARALSLVGAVPGRLELVGSPAVQVLVDYAHTPAALERVLRDLRSIRPTSRFVVVFGCGGSRDRAKRPLMGAIASQLADEIVVTSDNPRGEDPEAIIDEVLAGANGPATVQRVVDRAAAIASAVTRASDGDVVLIAGKGHETTQEIEGRLEPFDDRIIAAAALEARSSAC